MHNRRPHKRALLLFLQLLVLLGIDSLAIAQGWQRIPIPTDASPGREWQLQEDLSDDFAYEFKSTNELATINGKWRNYYFGPWSGPGTTTWRHENVAVSNGKLRIHASRMAGEKKSFAADQDGDGSPEELNLPATRLGCITSLAMVESPAYIEARVKIPNAVLAANVWLLSADSTQEIDILESYGGRGDDNRNDWLAQKVHFSHHVFIREPFQDYQPKDNSTWYKHPRLNSKRGGGYWTGRYHRFGVYWRDPTHLEYYLDGKLVKTTSGLNDTAEQGGIDPLGYTRDTSGERTGLNKPMQIIINMEAQTWNAAAGRTPTDKELKRKGDHTYLVDWVRVYKPVESYAETNAR